MSIERLSRNETVPVSATPVVHQDGSEKHARRSVEQRHIRPLDASAANAKSGSKQRYPRYIPSATATQLLTDALLIACSQVLILDVIRSRLDIASYAEVGTVVGFSTLLSLVLLYATGCYRRDAVMDRSVAIGRIPTALTLAGLTLFVGLHYVFPYIFPAHSVFLSISRCLTIVLIGTSISLISSILSRNIIRVLMHGDVFRRHVLVIGMGQRANHIEAINYSHGGLQEVYFVKADVLLDPGAQLGNAAQPSLNELVENLTIDEIVIAIDDHSKIPLDNLLLFKTRGIPVTSFNSFVERQTGRIEMNWLEMQWLIHTPGFQSRLIDDGLKRLTDIAISFAALILCLPVLLVAILAIRIDSPGPVIYRQQRVTRGGRVFWLYKLRSMRVDAEINGAKWADKDDPRITKVGSFMRRTRLDEIPQLINILKGDMAIVGPRPERPCFVDELSHRLDLYHLRHTMRAGLTGWAQINYQYGASFEDSQRKLEYDLFYIKNFSLLRDWAIMLQTLRVILWPDGVR